MSDTHVLLEGVAAHALLARPLRADDGKVLGALLVHRGGQSIVRRLERVGRGMVDVDAEDDGGLLAKERQATHRLGRDHVDAAQLEVDFEEEARIVRWLFKLFARDLAQLHALGWDVGDGVAPALRDAHARNQSRNEMGGQCWAILWLQDERAGTEGTP